MVKMETSKLSSKFQLKLPKPVREDLGAQEGDRIMFERDERGRWTILRVPSDTAEAQRHGGTDRAKKVYELCLKLVSEVEDNFTREGQ